MSSMAAKGAGFLREANLMRGSPRRPLVGLLSLFLLTQLAACATWNPGESLQAIYWNMKKKKRTPGEKLISHAKAVWEEYECAKQPLPFLKIENNEVIPPQLPAGEELNHRLTYVLCQAKPSKAISGDLTRSIYYRGQILFQDVSRSFQIKTGRWSIDVFIRVPRAAKPGPYTLEVRFDDGTNSFRKEENFTVVAAKR